MTSTGMQETTSAPLKAMFNVLNNIPTLFMAVILAVAVDWALTYFGPNKEKRKMSETNQAMEP